MDIDTSKIKEVLGSDQVKQLLPYLLAGAGGAALGGVMTGGRREHTNESRISYLGRILRNAALSGGLAAGSAALLHKGWDSTAGAVDKKNPITGSKGNEGPGSTLLRGLAFSPWTAAASGAAGLAATNKFSIGSGKKGQDAPLGLLAKGLGTTPDDLRAATAADIHRLTHDSDGKILQVQGAGGVTHHAGKLRRAANLPSGKGVGGILSNITRRGPLSTFGATTGRRVGRGALGLLAAGAPAFTGAFLTNDPES